MNLLSKVGMKAGIVFLSSILLFTSCGNSNTSSATSENKPEKVDLEIVDTAYIPKNLIAGTINRAIDPANPPVKIDLKEPGKAGSDFDLARCFQKATVNILEFPSDSGSFTYNKPIALTFSRGMQSMYDQTRVMGVNDRFLVSDLSNGIFEYDSTGTYSGTIHRNQLSGLKYDKRQKCWVISSDRWNSASLLTPVKGYTLYMEIDSLKQYTLGIWDPKLRQTVKKKIVKRGHPLSYPVLNDTLRYMYRRTAFDKKSEKPMLYFFNEKGDTLGKAQDYISLREHLKQNYTGGADQLIQYKYDGIIHLRQPYSDTIFRLLSPKKMQPAYLIDFGKHKPSIDTGYYGDKSDSYMLQQWSEKDNLLFIIYSKNYDCPRTREDKAITFYYAVYDKQQGKLSYLDMNEAYPDNALLTNSLPGALPLFAEQFQITGSGKVYAKYFKEDLENIIKSPYFAKLPTQQQDLVKQTAQALSPRKIAVMTLE